MIFYYNINGKLVTAWKRIKGRTPLTITKEEAANIAGFEPDGTPIPK